MVGSAGMKPKTNWSSPPRSARKRPILEGCTVAQDVLDALKDYCEQYNKRKSEVVEAALRQYLRIDKSSGESG